MYSDVILIGCEERKKLIEVIRKKGCFEYNTDENYNKGTIIVSRRPKIRKNSGKDYKACPNCKGYFSKYSIRRHYPKCIPDHFRGDRSISVMSRIVEGKIHKKASEVLRRVFCPLRDDNVTKTIRYDELVIILGNTLCEKYRLEHMHKMIRSKLRLIGRFILEVKRLDNGINSFTDVFNPEKFDTALTAINRLGGLDANRQQYFSPSTAAEMGTLLKKSAKLLITLCIKTKDKKKKLEVEDFQKILEEDLPIFVNKTVMESQLRQKRQNKIKLPSTQEITQFNKYVEKNRLKYHAILQKQYSFIAWKQLSSYCLIAIQLFNRKRAGEVERITIEDFHSFDSIDTDENRGLLQSDYCIGSDAKNYIRFVIRGKKARGVPVIVSNEIVSSIKLLLKERAKAGVPEGNPYLFGIPGNSTVFSHLSACELMRKFSKESGIRHPEIMRGTQLRKHIATQSALLNLEEGEIADLANFMGHAEKIHRDHYRVPIVAREIGRISQLLEIGVGKKRKPTELF